jgi:uncharacterized surface protein with fasciclin (FAS1) repeats
MRVRTSHLALGCLAFAVLVSPLTSASGGTAKKYDSNEKMSTMTKKDIVDTAVAAGSFKTLVAAVQAGGLVDALKGDGPFTVFAPSDEAFAKLPEGTLQNLLEPKNRDMLVSILKYHVVAGRVPAKQAATLDFAVTLNGQRVGLVFENDKLRIDGATVISADIEASNGIIHVIDTVILPADKNIVQTAIAGGSFQTLVAAIGAAGLAEVLANDGPFTVFAPTDDAFAALPKGTVETLLKPENRDRLIDILKYHVVAGRVYADEALAAGKAKTLQGGWAQIAAKNGTARINDSKILSTDVEASNGVIHVIDRVLMPADGRAMR